MRSMMVVFYFLALNSAQIQLVQSRPYRMRKLAHQAAFFLLLIDLFNYMASEKNHIGYLNNNSSNPYILCPVMTLFFVSILAFSNLVFMIVLLSGIRRK